MRALTHCLTLFAFLVASTVHAQPVARDTPQTDLPRTTLRVDQHPVQVQLARSNHEKEVGLMYRRHLPENEGMLFVFEQPRVQCFWMRNTLLPLTAAFVADDGRIVNLADMQPLSDTPHCSSEPVRKVLEMNQGWFQRHGVRAGSRLHHPMFEH